MKGSIRKVLLFIAALSAYSFSEVPIDSFTYINSFTSATTYQSLMVYFSKVYKNRAEINWSEDWPFDNKVRDYKIRWGKEAGVYTDSIELKPYINKVMNTVVLQNLESGTKYYADIYRDYNSKVWLRNFVFTTPPLDPILAVPVTDTGYIDPAIVRFSKPATNLGKKADIKNIDITTISGQRVSRIPFTSFQLFENGILRSKLVPGLYIASFKSKDNVTLTTSKFVIN